MQTERPRVSLIAESGFDLEFFRQFARDGLRVPELRELRVLEESPSFYVEVGGSKGFLPEIAARLERVARRIVPDMPGERLHVVRWDTGPTARPVQEHWIVVERLDQDGLCGSAIPGASAGQIWLNGIQPGCRIEAAFAHEIGHALGFFHVDRPGSLMHTPTQSDAPSPSERRHAAIAYSRERGSLDLDRDPQARRAGTGSAPRRLIEGVLRPTPHTIHPPPGRSLARPHQSNSRRGGSIMGTQ